jgi:glyoxylase-like metal-dependent hydrolase (beta-lactamase superfamily II)
VTAVPRIGFDLPGWRTPATQATRLVVEGDVVDLGDRGFEVLHVPGNTSGSIALVGRRAAGVLFTGDTSALDDPLSTEDEAAFVDSLERLRALPVELDCAGHSRPFGRAELRGLIDGELRRRS